MAILPHYRHGRSQEAGGPTLPCLPLLSLFMGPAALRRFCSSLASVSPSGDGAPARRSPRAQPGWAGDSPMVSGWWPQGSACPELFGQGRPCLLLNVLLDVGTPPFRVWVQAGCLHPPLLLFSPKSSMAFTWSDPADTLRRFLACPLSCRGLG